MEEHELFLDLSLSYLDSAIFLCEAMVHSEFIETYSRGKVVLSNSFHAVELFLKSAISKSGIKPPGHHDVRKIAQLYQELYPNEDFKWDIPFLIEYLGFKPEDREKYLKNEPPIDQQHRYHTNKKGQKWYGVFGFEAKGMLSELKAIDKDIKKLIEPIFGKTTANKSLHRSAKSRAW